MIKFYKISEKQWLKDSTCKVYDASGNEKQVISKNDQYANIKLPKRATTGSAGYDMYSPFSFKLEPGEMVHIPLGIKAEMDDRVVLFIVPRSGLGFKYGFQLTNTIGVIDSDYFYADNEGHIQAKFRNTLHTTLMINEGDAICQGIFMNYLITDDDDTNGIRNGGFGSTDKKN
ncbi:MAG: deoxyuridine 5'-triphosphate nucleotidohydrolase [Lachnospiraceae bacterium]|nr:deoxyuridine 5'-triphosphate nucleotidohydrolase [Lachnospiraceae bacterium]